MAVHIEVALLTIGSLGLWVCYAQESSSIPNEITAARPLAELTTALQRETGKPVTYEDPVWEWSGELESIGSSNAAKWNRFPRRRHFVMQPIRETPDGGSTEWLTNMVKQYNSQENGSRFKVISSRLGVHVVPDQTPDGSGQLGTSKNLLDTLITVPTEARTATEHFRVLCEAVSAASGIEVRLGVGGPRPWLDDFFGAESRQFPWGTSGVVAREATIELMMTSASSLSWKLFCQASREPRDRFCVMNIRPIEMKGFAGDGKPSSKVLFYDRCAQCARPNRVPPPALKP